LTKQQAQEYGNKQEFKYLSDLAGLSIAGTLHLVGASLSEANAEQPEHVIVSGLNINMGLNKCLPLFYK
jgi:hypothetical protein